MLGDQSIYSLDALDEIRYRRRNVFCCKTIQRIEETYHFRYFDEQQNR
jgi:hypothetical protein